MAPQDAPTGHTAALFHEQSGVASPVNFGIHIAAWIPTWSGGGVP